MIVQSRRHRQVWDEDDILLHFPDANYTGDGGYLVDSLNSQVLGSFAPNVLPYTVYQGRKLARSWEARTNQFIWAQAMDRAEWLRNDLYDVIAAIDPLGGNTAQKVIPNTTALGHYIRQIRTPDGSSKYTMSVTAGPDGYDWMLFQMYLGGFPGTPRCYFDLDLGATGINGDINSKSIEDLSSFYQCVITATSNAGGAVNFIIYVAEADGDVTFNGDEVKGIRPWNPQLEIGASPSPPIKTEASPVARAKDSIIWPAAVVPPQILGGAWRTRIVSGESHTDPANDKYVLAKDANNFVRWNNTSKRYEAYAGGVKKIESNALTLVREVPHDLIVRANTGKMEVIGAAGGDGETSGTAYAWTAGDIYGGQDHTGNKQINGIFEQPRAA